MGGTCISRRFHIGYVNSRRMCVVGLDWQPTTPTRRRELSHTPAYYVIRPIPEGAFVILYENAPCAPVLCAWPLSFFHSCREEPSRVTRRGARRAFQYCEYYTVWRTSLWNITTESEQLFFHQEYAKSIIFTKCKMRVAFLPQDSLQ